MALWDRVYRLEQRIRPHVPFTALNTVRRLMDREARSIVDIGCGDGGPARFLATRRGTLMVGVDIFLPYLAAARNRGKHDGLVLADVAKSLPFRHKSFDVVLAMEVLEHLDRQDGHALLREMERLARQQVIVSTPVGSHKQDPYDGNPYQEHRHIWRVGELRELGYSVRGHGMRNIGGLSGVQSRLPGLVRPFMDVVWVAAGLATYFLPGLSGEATAWKKMEGSE